MRAWWDRLPAWVQHPVIVFSAVAAGSLAQDVVEAEGVTGVDWLPALVTAVDAGALATVTAMTALVLTPLTRKYGLTWTRGRHS